MKPTARPWWAIMLVLAACAPASGDEEGFEVGPRPDNATRSPTCLAWQDATCDHVADDCQTLGRGSCDEEFSSLFCRSDEEVQACINALGAASCSSAPDDCKDVADPAPAQWYCRLFIEVLCARGEACNIATQAACVEESETQLDCDAVVGAGPSVDACLNQLNGLSCAALGNGQLPEDCVDVFKSIQSAAWTGRGPDRVGGVTPWALREYMPQ